MTTITGLAEVQAKLKAAPSIIVARLFAKALDQAIGVIAAEVEERCPRGEEDELAENIVTKVQLDLVKIGGSAACGFSTHQSERTGAPFDAIALWLEYGHGLVSHSGKQIGTVAAYPFMRPAFTASADRAVEVFRKTIIEGVDAMGDL